MINVLFIFQVLVNDFFLVACRDDFIENARLFIFETFCRIHQCISIRYIFLLENSHVYISIIIFSQIYYYSCFHWFTSSVPQLLLSIGRSYFDFIFQTF